MKVAGEKSIIPFLEKLDKLKVAKIRSYFERSSANAAGERDSAPPVKLEVKMTKKIAPMATLKPKQTVDATQPMKKDLKVLLGTINFIESSC
jgi:hypothetical protein